MSKTDHRHCEIPGCHEIATREVGAFKDGHQNRGFDKWERRMWVCTGHTLDGLAQCANLQDGDFLFPFRKVVVVNAV